MAKYRAKWSIKSLSFTHIDVWIIEKKWFWFWLFVTQISEGKGEAAREKARDAINQLKNNEGFIE